MQGHSLGQGYITQDDKLGQVATSVGALPQEGDTIVCAGKPGKGACDYNSSGPLVDQETSD